MLRNLSGGQLSGDGIQWLLCNRAYLGAAGVNTFLLPLPGLARGLYFLRVEGASVRETVKLVKE